MECHSVLLIGMLARDLLDVRHMIDCSHLHPCHSNNSDSQR